MVQCGPRYVCFYTPTRTQIKIPYNRLICRDNMHEFGRLRRASTPVFMCVKNPLNIISYL